MIWESGCRFEIGEVLWLLFGGCALERMLHGFGISEGVGEDERVDQMLESEVTDNVQSRLGL